MWRVVHRIEAAGERIGRAAQQAEDAAQRIAAMLEHGYGGNGLRLIELLEAAQSAPSVPSDEQIDALMLGISEAAECYAKHWGLPMNRDWPAFYRQKIRAMLAAAPEQSR